MNAKQIVKIICEEANALEAKAEGLRAIASEVEMLSERYSHGDEAMEKVARISTIWREATTEASE